MNLLPDELRLVLAIAVNGLLLWSAFRATSRLADALLLSYLVQYVAVCGLGLMHILTPEALCACGLLTAVGFYLWGRRIGPTTAVETPDSIFAGGGIWFFVGYFAALIFTVGTIGTVGDDALMYHLPIPANWLREHRLTFFTTWFSNPANSYSPLAVEAFLAWLIAPVGNDVLAHFVQVPALLMIYLASVEVMRGLRVREPIAVMIALAAVLCRPLVSQSILAKDDIFVAAFFMMIVAALSRERLTDRLGPWRIGIAFGLFAATKYTALQSAPILLLAIDAPIRAGWRMRQWLIAILAAGVICGPWYLRNIAWTGNPLYPVPLQVGSVSIFKGLFFPSPSAELHTLAGIWKTLTGGYQGIAPTLVALILGGWLVGAMTRGKDLASDPMVRICVLGPLVGLAVFFSVSHAPEIRYAYPGLILLFLGFALAIQKMGLATEPAVPLAAATILAVACVLDGFAAAKYLVLVFCLVGAGCAALAWLIRWSKARRFFGVAGSCIAAAAIYVYWPSVISGARMNALNSLEQSYPNLTPAWRAALEVSPPQSPIAYTNLALVRPLMGFDYSHPIVYIPTRAGVSYCHDLPAGAEHIPEPQFRAFVAQLLMSDADQQNWLDHLLASGAECLVIGKQPYMPRPPEMGFAEQDHAHFQLVFENDAAAIYRIIR